jgi:uncharacterized protein
MSLKERIQKDMQAAMRSKDARRLGVIRLLMAAIKQREIDERITLDDTEVVAVIEKMLKQRRESLSQFQSAGRQDLADQESYEISVLHEYLPEQLSANEIEQLIADALNETHAASMKDMGKIMAILKPKLQGRADLSEVSKKIKSALESKQA